MSRQTRIADAAIRTLAAEGMRGLTHRAVDRAADLPQGSTSYYFLTRSALLTGTVDRLAEIDTADLPAHAAGVPAPTEAANVLVACMDGLLVDQTVGAGDRQLGVDDLRAILPRLVDAASGLAGSHHAPKRPTTSPPE